MLIIHHSGKKKLFRVLSFFLIKLSMSVAVILLEVF